MRPELDVVQQREYIAQSKDGRTAEAFKTVLEYHGFKLHPPGCVCPGCRAVYHDDGIWRHDRLQMAYTPDDVAMHFPSPERFDQWAREQKTSKRLQAKRVPKAEIRKALARR